MIAHNLWRVPVYLVHFGPLGVQSPSGPPYLAISWEQFHDEADLRFDSGN